MNFFIKLSCRCEEGWWLSRRCLFAVSKPSPTKQSPLKQTNNVLMRISKLNRRLLRRQIAAPRNDIKLWRRANKAERI
jgi:hypothetical protein